jgi:hypothetical protein
MIQIWQTAPLAKHRFKIQFISSRLSGPIVASRLHYRGASDTLQSVLYCVIGHDSLLRIRWYMPALKKLSPSSLQVHLVV